MASCLIYYPEFFFGRGGLKMIFDDCDLGEGNANLSEKEMEMIIRFRSTKRIFLLGVETTMVPQD